MHVEYGVMNFDILVKDTVFLNPLDNMKPKTIPSEVRFDPLVRRTARVCHFRALAWQKPDLEKLAEQTRQSCPFCPERVMQMTPAFPPEILPEGRLVDGDMVLFPNLAPYDSLSVVLVMGAEHVVPLNAFEPARIAGAFRLALRFFRRMKEIEHPEALYHVVTWNYMPASGSTIVHPHLQVFSTSSAPNLLRRELEAARNYTQTYGSNYWDDLVKEEEGRGERFLGRIGRTAWLGSFAPLGAVGDVVGVVDGVPSTLELSDRDVDDLATGLTRAMAAYDSMGVSNFNMGFFTGAEGDDFTRLHVVFTPRIYLHQVLGTPDAPAPRFMYNESVCMGTPEEICRTIKPFFAG